MVCGMVHGCRKLRRYPSLLSPSLAERQVRSRHESRNDKDLGYAQYYSPAKKKSSSSSPLRRILDRRQMDGISSRWRGCECRNYLQVCTLYHRGGKDASSIPGVPLAPCHSSTGSISDVDNWSRRVQRLTTPWIGGRKSSSL